MERQRRIRERQRERLKKTDILVFASDFRQ